MRNDYYLIGCMYRQDGNTYYTYGETDNGYVFKSEKAFKKRSGVCYIPEYAFDDCDIYTDDNGTRWTVVTDDNTPESFYTYKDFYDMVKSYADDTLESELLSLCDKQREKFYERCVSDVFDIVDWQDPSSLLYADYDMHEAFECFLSETNHKNKK